MRISKEKLWKRFSRYIRETAGGDSGFCTCVTCGYINHWKKFDAGHFIDRRWLPTMFDEMNVHPQCKKCNQMEDGATESYEYYLEITYGPGTVDKLKHKSIHGPNPDLWEIDKKLKEHGY